MNQKLPIHELSSKIALATGISEDSAEVFVKNFFDILSEELMKGETVKVKGLGEFSLSDTNGETTVTFVSDKELAEALNAPFSIFEPVTLNDEVTDSMLEIRPETDAEQEAESIETPQVEQSQIEDASLGSHGNQTVPLHDQTEDAPTAIESQELSPKFAVAPAQEEEVKAKTETPNNTEIKVGLKEVSKPLAEAPVAKPAEKQPITILDEDPEVFVERESPGTSNGNFWWGLIIGLIVGLAIGACSVYLAIDHLFPGGRQQAIQLEQTDETAPIEETPAELETNAANDSVAATNAEPAKPENQEVSQAEVQTREEPKPKAQTDTIRRGYLIHDMAKNFFGSKDFWVYIYEENKAKIGNPNNMQPGVVLVIPSPEKYGIVPGNPESLKKARQKAGEILAKYPR